MERLELHNVRYSPTLPLPTAGSCLNISQGRFGITPTTRLNEQMVSMEHSSSTRLRIPSDP